MRWMMLWLAFSVLAVCADGQEPALSSKLDEVGAGWLIGTWTGTSPDGESLTLTYGQELGGQAGSVHLKMASLEMTGLIVVDPSTDEVTQFAATSIGAVVTGTWNDYGDGLAFEAVWRMPDGSRKERTYVHHRVDDKTLRVVVREGSRWETDAATHEVILKRTSG